jgi:hypothetical protein
MFSSSDAPTGFQLSLGVTERHNCGTKSEYITGNLEKRSKKDQLFQV